MPIPLNRLSDEELIAEAQRDNDTAFDILVGRNKDPLTNFVFRFLGDLDECQDIVQETFIRAYRNRKSYKPLAKFSTWVFTIATNLAKLHLRRRKLCGFMTGSRSRNEPDPVFEFPDEGRSPDAVVDSSITAERMQKALNALPLKFREIVILMDIQELSYEEILSITGLPMGTVKSRINRARSMLQTLLKDFWSE